MVTYSRSNELEGLILDRRNSNLTKHLDVHVPLQDLSFSVITEMTSLRPHVLI